MGISRLPLYDHYVDLRDRMLTNLINAGFSLEKGHHEVGTGGQAEINYKFNTLLHAADDMLLYKYIVKNTAWQAGKTVTFMPKPLFGDNGSGMHTHQSLWKDGSPLMYDETGYAGLSDTARHYIGGLLHHAPSLLAFTNPTVNSYKRLVPGYEAPINLVYSQRNRSACVRIPITGSNPKAKRLEFRCPDSSGNPYLAFSAMLMAGLDGIKNKIEPQAPVDKDLYELPPEEAANIPQAPTQLSAVIDRLEEDHEYLTEGGVFTPDLIETWISFKRENEILPVQIRPHPVRVRAVLRRIGQLTPKAPAGTALTRSSRPQSVRSISERSQPLGDHVSDRHRSRTGSGLSLDRHLALRHSRDASTTRIVAGSASAAPVIIGGSGPIVAGTNIFRLPRHRFPPPAATAGFADQPPRPTRTASSSRSAHWQRFRRFGHLGG